jgi:magnesium chelatase family protein
MNQLLMKLMSLNQYQNQWSLVQVEISFIPGLPQVHFLGQADTILKESVFRLKSAFRSCGYEFPRAQQVVVNLTPKHVKKISPGIELAVALGILKMTGQGPEWNPGDYVVYGDISLTGEVYFPDCGKPFQIPTHLTLLSGPGFEKYSNGFLLNNLKNLNSIKKIEKTVHVEPSRPRSLVSSLTPRQAEVIETLAVGEHHALLAGSQGSGKSIVFDALPAFLRPPSETEIYFHQNQFGKTINWRAVARPHHTITPQSMVGGGVPPKPGEITRAHGGALLLDEMMEFKPQALEVLREALSHHEVTVSRGLKSETFKADFQLVGTTNLCPCGKWVPKKAKNCGYNERRCLSTMQKLSGPLLDRLQGFFFFQDKMEKWSISDLILRKKIEGARELQSRQGRIHNRMFQEADLKGQEAALWQNRLEVMNVSSARRRQSCVAWARTLADLDISEVIQKQHFEKAFEQTIENYQNLIKWGGGLD